MKYQVVTNEEILDLFYKDVPKYTKHREIMLADLKNWDKVMEPFKNSVDSMGVHRDFSQNFTYEWWMETQQIYMSRNSFAIHGQIIWHNSVKYYFITVCDVTSHLPELVMRSLKFALETIERIADCKIQSMIIKSDNCAAEYTVVSLKFKF